jgi:hypothetical protein
VRRRVQESRVFFVSAMIFSTAAYTRQYKGQTRIVQEIGSVGGVAEWRRTMADVNSFSRDSKIASLDLFPIIKCGVRAAARLIPRISTHKERSRIPFHDMLDGELSSGEGDGECWGVWRSLV